ncbi:hypothetical protein AWJ00_14665 [Listeria monocytogenes]|uniref:hypothetical protein n=1 Tax=Listeria monocytogenes TaxID=1639 RepID=UPI000775E674|nr:hypothetical protein [Listeria monocytogenes]EJS5945043.1 hypothetical protein [Listeria monocytogenes]EJS6011794.1 hypothetical protein [Listeria monocytogenes]EJS6023651.1 hypothetical protein [Listeria monocytogenes]EJS6044739.1 hypothetical protein [Listeria monocytogenes]EJS6061067.1 hypothetical protein [Listeria monocytogenes]
MKLYVKIENMNDLIQEVEKEATNLYYLDYTLLGMEDRLFYLINNKTINIGTEFSISELINPERRPCNYIFEVKEINEETSTVVMMFKKKEVA